MSQPVSWGDRLLSPSVLKCSCSFFPSFPSISVDFGKDVTGAMGIVVRKSSEQAQ